MSKLDPTVRTRVIFLMSRFEVSLNKKEKQTDTRSAVI
jgi:hypothetical protein